MSLWVRGEQARYALASPCPLRLPSESLRSRAPGVEYCDKITQQKSGSCKFGGTLTLLDNIAPLQHNMAYEFSHSISPRSQDICTGHVGFRRQETSPVTSFPQPVSSPLLRRWPILPLSSFYPSYHPANSKKKPIVRSRSAETPFCTNILCFIKSHRSMEISKTRHFSSSVYTTFTINCTLEINRQDRGKPDAEIDHIKQLQASFALPRLCHDKNVK